MWAKRMIKRLSLLCEGFNKFLSQAGQLMSVLPGVAMVLHEFRQLFSINCQEPEFSSYLAQVLATRLTKNT
jgi:hypothetical protein